MTVRQALVILCGSAVLAPAQWIHVQTPNIPRTRSGRPDLAAPGPRASDGRPDLSGIWDADYSVPRIPPGVIIESSQGPDFSLQFWRKNAAPIPMTPWGRTVFEERDQSFGAGRPSARCLPHSIPDAMLVGNFKIIQSPGLTIVLQEAAAHFRQIFTDGRKLPKDPNPAWLGYSIGRWDHDVFVVDTTGFNDRSWLDDAGHPHSDQLHVTERFRRRDFGHLEAEVRIEDPKAYTRPWSVTVHFRLLPDTELMETVCENEKDSTHLVGRASFDNGKTIELAPEVLSEYTGAYELNMAGGPAVFYVSSSNGRLVLAGTELKPVSRDGFLCAYGTVKFVRDAGAVTSMIVGWSTGGEDEFFRQSSFSIRKR